MLCGMSPQIIKCNKKWVKGSNDYEVRAMKQKTIEQDQNIDSSAQSYLAKKKGMPMAVKTSLLGENRINIFIRRFDFYGRGYHMPGRDWTWQSQEIFLFDNLQALLERMHSEDIQGRCLESTFTSLYFSKTQRTNCKSLILKQPSGRQH